MSRDQPQLNGVQAQQPGLQLLGIETGIRRRRGERITQQAAVIAPATRRRRVEGLAPGRNQQQVLQILDAHLEHGGQFCPGGGPAQRGDQRRRDPLGLGQQVRPAGRDADRPAELVRVLAECLADPPIAVGRNPVSAGRIELLDSALQAFRASLQQVGQVGIGDMHPEARPAHPGDMSHQAEIGRHHSITGTQAPAADCCRGSVGAGLPVLPPAHHATKVELLSGGEQWNPAGLAQPVADHVVAGGHGSGRRGGDQHRDRADHDGKPQEAGVHQPHGQGNHGQQNGQGPAGGGVTWHAQPPWQQPDRESWRPQRPCR